MKLLAPALFLLALCATVALAVDPDVLFKQARDLGAQGKRDEARKLCQQILEDSPEYADVRIYLGRLYSWDSMYDDAFRELKTILSKNPKNGEAWEALLDAELWSDNPDGALRDVEDALKLLPGRSGLLYRKARALKNKGKIEEAHAVVLQAYEADRSNTEARDLLETLDEATVKWGISLSYQNDYFTHTFSPWHMLSAAFERFSENGAIIGTVNGARRFDENGVQVQLEAYPHIADGTYLYLAGGYAPQSFFPTWLGSGELYHNFPHGIETSLGFRYMQFSNSVLFYTGTLGKYIGNWFIDLRLFYTPDPIGNSISGTLYFRRFWDQLTYFTFKLISGVSYDQPTYSFQVYRLESYGLGADFERRITTNWYLWGSCTVERQKLDFGYYQLQITSTAGVQRRF